ncbi:MAG TPA: hypothetical protein VJT32_02745 [bacterium]|nr:hypothetical protein [bacterium]
MPRRVGRPRTNRPRATAVITRRVRRLVDLAHEGNLSEASRVTGLSYPTIRDLYTGRTTNPSAETIEALRKPYHIYPKWFTDAQAPEAVPASGRVGLLAPDPRALEPRRVPVRYREVLIPFAAWSMYEVFVTLEDWLDSLPPSAERPIVGKATEEEFTRRLTTFLLSPLLAADRELGAGGQEPPTARLIRDHNDRPEDWVRLVRSLGDMWQETLRGTLQTAKNTLRGD